MNNLANSISIYNTYEACIFLKIEQKNNMLNDQDHFNVLREIQKNPESSQRELARGLGFSLGKLNYCLKGLKQKGLKLEGLKSKRS